MKRVNLLVFGGCLLFLAGSAQAALIAHYNFEDAADIGKDVVGALDMTVNEGTPLLQTETRDGSGHSVYLDGFSSLGITVPTSSPIRTGTVSIAFWFKSTWRDTNPISDSFVISWSDPSRNFGAENTPWAIYQKNTDRGLSWRMNSDDFDWHWFQGGVWSPDMWYHVVITHTDYDTHMYVNGISTGYIAGGSNGEIKTALNPTSLYIGVRSLAPGHWWDTHYWGNIDDLRIYNEIIDANTIAALATPTCPEINPATSTVDLVQLIDSIWVTEPIGVTGYADIAARLGSSRVFCLNNHSTTESAIGDIGHYECWYESPDMQLNAAAASYEAIDERTAGAAGNPVIYAAKTGGGLYEMVTVNGKWTEVGTMSTSEYADVADAVQLGVSDNDVFGALKSGGLQYIHYGAGWVKDTVNTKTYVSLAGEPNTAGNSKVCYGAISGGGIDKIYYNGSSWVTETIVSGVEYVAVCDNANHDGQYLQDVPPMTSSNSIFASLKNGGVESIKYESGAWTRTLVSNKEYTKLTPYSSTFNRFYGLAHKKTCGDFDTIYLDGDVNKDCRVDFKDLAKLAANWLGCTNPQGCN